jgi:hypothetical protein
MRTVLNVGGDVFEEAWLCYDSFMVDNSISR